MSALPTAASLLNDIENEENRPAHPVLHRPELRLHTDMLLVSTSASPASATETIPDSADTTDSPTDTVVDNTPPSLTLDALHIASNHGSLVAPPVRVHATYASPGGTHAPYVPSHPLSDPIYRFPSAPQLPATGPNVSAPDIVISAPEPREQPGVFPARRLAHSSSLDSYVSSSSSSASTSPRASLAHPYARIYAEKAEAPMSPRASLAHPYARIYAKKAEAPTVKRRKMWNHALEKSLFTPEEIASLGAPIRRAIYTASLENHIDQLHGQLLSIGLYPVPFEALAPYRGLNSKTVKSMVAGLHKDECDMKTKLMELDRATQALYRNGLLKGEAPDGSSSEGAGTQARRHSVAAASYVYPNLFAGSSDATKSTHHTVMS